jgi:hypothetical protein
MATCYRTATRPKLDGDLSDAAWQHARPLDLHAADQADGGWSTTGQFACDEQFLYVAVSCANGPQDNYDGSAAGRTRDADLSQHDRIDILLDMDRDYATYYRLTVDYRGWPAEDLCGDAQWNPQWFIARRADAHGWTIEVAIPWQELTMAAPAPDAVWALGVQRTAPNSGFQSWCWPAAPAPIPQGFGLLVFQN